MILAILFDYFNRFLLKKTRFLYKEGVIYKGTTPLSYLLYLRLIFPYATAQHGSQSDGCLITTRRSINQSVIKHSLQCD